jgi:hypothetical protein
MEHCEECRKNHQEEARKALGVLKALSEQGLSEEEIKQKNEKTKKQHEALVKSMTPTKKALSLVIDI